MSAPGPDGDPSQPPVVRVVTVLYHPGPELDRFVESLATATRAPLELVMVDNGDDHTRGEQVAARHGATLLTGAGNVGYGRAANLGAAGARAPWLVVANPDVEWRPGSLDELLAIGEQVAGAGALGPAVLQPDGTVYPSGRELPSLTQGVGHALVGRVWPANPWTRAYHARQELAGAQRACGWLSGSCLLLRREAFEQVGGFDPGYFMFFEDVDLGERLGLAGWANVYAPSAEVVHTGGTSWRATPAPMIRAHHRSARRYLVRRYHQWYYAPVRWAITVGLAVRQQAELVGARR